MAEVGYELAPEIQDYYTNTRDEARRLVDAADGRMEMIRTRELLRRHLPPAPGDVLDVGGGTGAHSAWLAVDGHRVTLIDPMPHHVEAARAAGIDAREGDGRALDAPDASVDVVLMAGPLYHLPDPGERALVLSEACRVLRPGGLLAAAAIGRYASIFENAAIGALANPRVEAAVAGIFTTGELIRPKHFTTAFFHTPELLDAELTNAGFGDVTVYGIEGPAWGLLKAVEAHSGQRVADDDPLFVSVLAAARMAEAHPALLAAASHLLAVGWAPQ